jgi:Amt family ammonium transporter
LRGNFGELFVELGAIAIAYVIAAVGTWLILKFISATIGLRVPEEAENQGLDVYEHGEEGYNSEFSDRINT